MRVRRTSRRTPPLYSKWKHLSHEALSQLAHTWFRELRDPPRSGVVSNDVWTASDSVIFLNFAAPPDQQWEFITAAFAIATSDDDLEHLAAGPVEHLLATHGASFIAMVEDLATADSRFRRLLTGVWRNAMTDDVWARLQAIQARASNPLAAYRPDA